MVKTLLRYKFNILILFFFWTAAVSAQCPTAVEIINTPSTDICEGTSITFTANPFGGSNWTYQWQINGDNVDGETDKTFTTTLSSTSTVSVIVNSNTCEPVSKTKTITILPKRTPTVTITPSKTQICLGEMVTFTARNTDGGTASYRWYIGGVEKQDVTSDTFKTTELTENNNEVKVILTSSYNCITPGEVSATSSVSIKPDATINTPANNNQTVCIRKPIEPIQFSIAGGGTGATVSGLPTGLSGSFSAGKFSISGSPTEAGEFNYTVTTTGTCAQTSASGTIKVNPAPNVVVPSAIEICNGENTSLISFSGTVSGTEYSWTNNNTSINLGASGTGNIPAFTAANTTNAPVTATITVTPKANGCIGASKSLQITVYPTPTVTTPSDIVICNGETISQLAFSGAVSGSTYHWTNTNTSINLAASGSGNISSFKAINTTNSPITAKITVTPVAKDCEGTAKSFEIVVNPTPNVDSISDITICNTGTVPQISFSGNVSGTTYTWTNDNPAIGLNSTGSGNIGSFTANNSTSSTITANITVTPKAADCSGVSETFKIVVNPTAEVKAISDIEICNGGSIPEIVFSGDVTGTDYTWTNSNTSIGLKASGTGNIPSFKATNNTSSTITATITVTPEAAECEGSPETFNIIVNPTATVDDISNIEVCNAAIIPQTEFTGGVAGTVYNWTNDNPDINLGSGGTGNIPPFTATNTTDSPISATITVTPVADGCQGAPKDFQIVVNHSLVPSVTITSDDEDNNICDTGDSVIFTASPINGGTTPSYQWLIDGNPVGSNGTNNTFTTSALTDGQSVSVEMTTTETCFTTEKVTSNEIIHRVYTALGDVIIDGPSGVCPTNSTFTYSVPEDENVLGYHWTVPSGFVIKSGQGTNAIAVSFTTPSTGDNIISLERSNPCITKTDNYTVTIDSYASVDAGPDQYVCVGTDSVILEGSIGGAVTGKGQNKWNWSWLGGEINNGDLGNLNAPFNLPPNAVGGDQFVITISTNTEVAGCNTQQDSMTIYVVAEPTVNAGTAATDIVCQSSSPNPITLTGASIGGGAIKGSWAIISGGGTLSNTAPTETPNSITYTPAADFYGEVTLELTTENPGDCSEVSTRRTITVKPNPSVDQPVDLVICDGDADNSVIFSGSSITGTTYNWENTNSSIGLGASGTGDITFDASNTTNAPISATITVTPVANGCEGTAKSFTVTVNPTATVNKPDDVASCNGDTIGTIIFTGSSVSGTTYKWVNNTPAIGLPAEGTGNIPGFGATNSGSTPVTAEITVTPVANNCEGTPETFSITVNPTPAVTKPAEVIVCAEGPVSEIIFTGSDVANTLYNWENNSPGIGLAESGTGNISEFNAINTTSEIITATITVTPVANDCKGIPVSFTITVNPKAGFTKPVDITACNDEAVLPINFTGSSVTNTTYTWENDTPSIGLADSGTGDIAEFNAINTSNQPVTATIIVTPVANNCEGTSETFTITVKPTPTVTVPTAITVCNAESISDIVFSGSTVANTSYKWVNDTPSIGLAESGTGNITGFNPTNSTTETITATITVTPVAEGCEGVAETFTITVSPTPVVTPPANITACAGEVISATNFTSSVSGTTYEWTIDKEIGLPLSGTGNLPEFTTSNNTTEPVEATINITPTAAECKGETKTFIITVNPIATVTAGEDQTICSSGPFTLEGSLSGGATSGTWSTSGSGSFSDNSVNAVYTPSASDILNGSVTLTFLSNDPEGPCDAASDSMILTIIEEVKITSQPFSVGVCTANDTQLEVAASGDDLTYTWYKVGITDPVGTGDIYKINNATASNAGDYYVIVNGNSVCSQVESNTVTVTVDKNIEVLENPGSDNICLGSSHTLTVNATASGNSTGIKYTWMYRPLGSTAESDWQDISEGNSLLLESADLEDSGEYRVRINGPEEYSCGIGYSEIATIKVYGVPTADAGAETVEICSTTSPIQIGTDASVSEGALGVWTTTGAGELLNATNITGATYIPTAEEFGQMISFNLTATLDVEGLEACTNSGSADTKNISIIQQPEITAFSYISTDPAATSAEFCETDLTPQTPLITINHQNGTGVYSVDGNGVENPLVVNAATGEFVPDGTSPGTYIITYTFTATATSDVCTTDSREFTVTIGERPSAEFSYNASSYCNNVSNPIPEVVGDGTLGDFTSATGLVFVDGGAPGEIDLKNSPQGEHIIVNTVDFDGDGCQPVSFETKIIIYAQPEVPEVTDLEYCLNEENAPGFSVTPKTGGSINWYESSDATTAMGSAPTINTSIVKTISYWVSETSADGCESERVEAKVIIHGLPEVSITNEVNPDGEEATICKGSSIVLTGNGAASYTWRIGSIESEISGKETTFSASPEETTTYFLVGQNENGCEDISQIKIIVDEPTVPGTLTGPQSVCEASPNGTLTLSDYTGEIQRWEKSEDNGTTWKEIAELTNTLNFTNLTTTTSFRAIVKNGVCDEMASNNIQVTIDKLPVGGKLSFGGNGRIFVTCENAVPGYGEILSLSENFGTLVGWEYRTAESTNWNIYTGTSEAFLTSDEVESLVNGTSSGPVNTTVFRAVLKNGTCDTNVYSATAIVSVVPTNIEPAPVKVEPAVLCYGNEITLSSETGYGDSIGKFDGGAFTSAGIKNNGWRFPAGDYTFDRDNGEPGPWGGTQPKWKFVTAELEEPYSTYDTWWNSHPEEEPNEHFAIAQSTYSSTMEPPVFNLSALDEAVLTFDQAFNLTPGASIRVEISTDGGATYNSVLYEVEGPAKSENEAHFSKGKPGVNQMSLDLGSYLGQTNLRVRFNYIGARSGDIWAVDNIKIPDGPRDIRLDWYYDDNTTDPDNELEQIGETNQEVVKFAPKKIGWNDFEVQTALILDSNGNACKSIENSKTIRVFVFDQYTTTTEIITGSCGDSSAQLNASVSGDFQGPIPASEITLDGYRGEWEITPPTSEATYSLKKQDENSSQEPLYNPNVILESDDIGDFIVKWVLIPTATYPLDYEIVDLQGDSIENTSCPPVTTESTLNMVHCTTLDFDGVDDYVDLGTGYPNPVSIEVWIRPFKRAITEGVFTDPTKGTIISGPGFELKMADLAGKIETDTRWYHIAVVNGTLYIDGIQSGSIEPGAGGAKALIGARWNNTTGEPENYFSGWIEEVRLWNNALTLKQIRFMMNQRIKEVSNPITSTLVEGEIVPIQGVNSYKTMDGINLDEDGDKWYDLTWNNLIGYYRLISDEPDPLGIVTYEHLQPQNGTTANLSIGGAPGILRNMETNQQNTSPLPYISGVDGKWTDINTWLRPDVWDIPNGYFQGSTEITWNIVKTLHNITSEEKDIEVLGLLVEAGELEIAHPTVTAPHWENIGQELRVTHYLNLDGAIDLIGESQLLQNPGSIIDPGSTGFLERDQQGTANSYNYNYWSPPVVGTYGDTNYAIEEVMKDGTTSTFKNLKFGDTYTHADGDPTDPRKVSTFWLYKFHGTAYMYSRWIYAGKSGKINVGEGFSMKGTSGTSAIEDQQNYTFKGMPNNGIISLAPILPGQDYLIGNPYPSAIDANEFIKDNMKSINEGRSDKDKFNGVLYFWSHFAGGDTHYLQEYIGGYAIYTTLGGTVAYANDARIDATGDDGGLEPQQYIPVGQAFFVSTKKVEGETEGGKLIFKNSQRYYMREDEDSSVFHSQTILEEKVKEDKRSKIWLKFDSPKGYHRQLLVTVDPNTSNGFDIGYDAPLIENNKEDMYWVFDESKFVIQGVAHFNEDQELPLGIKVQKEEKFTISIDKFKNVPDDKPIYLKDSILGITHNLRKGPYEATAPAGVVDNRFKIVFRLQENPDQGEEVDLPDEEDEVAAENEDIEILTGIELLYLTNSSEIIIHNPQLIDLQNMVLNNILGQKVHEFFELPLQKEVKLPVKQLSSGVYIIKLRTEKGVLTEKIIIEEF